jgi:hypothetical protein
MFQPLIVLPPPAELEPVYHRHQDIGNNQVRRVLLRSIQCPGAIPDGCHIEPVSFEDRFQQVQVLRVVVSDEDSGHGHSTGRRNIGYRISFRLISKYYDTIPGWQPHPFHFRIPIIPGILQLKIFPVSIARSTRQREPEHRTFPHTIRLHPDLPAMGFNDPLYRGKAGANSPYP